MERGMISLTSLQVETILELLETTSENALLKQKLDDAHQQSHNGIDVELSEDEVEKILDQLPPPPADEATQEIRKKLTQFLLSRRVK